MTEERRYDEREVSEILDRATAQESSAAPQSRPGAGGLTLSELKEIGSEVGIPQERIAQAAQALETRRLTVPPKTFLGTPRSVSRMLSIPRLLDDDEWTRLVVDLRETFEAMGEVRIQGDLRSWSNGNLQVHVEPHGDRYRVRMRTHKGNLLPNAFASAAFIFMGGIFLLLTLLGEANSGGAVMGLVFGLVGLVQLAYSRFRLPQWAEERAAQMEGLAERIPLLLKD